MQRVHIIGGPGSGKTTLARKLAAEVGVPATDLDEVAYASGAGRKRTLAERAASVQQIVAQPRWVTEGIYLWWVDELFRSADRIVWLDVPWGVAAWRIVQRHVRASMAGTNRHPGLGKLARFLWHTRGYYLDVTLRDPRAADDDGAITRAQTRLELANYADRVVVMR